MTLNTELNELILEFQLARESKARKFPEDLWKRAVSLAKRTSIKEVCKHLHITSSHLYKKLRSLNPSEATVKFVEAICPEFSQIVPTVSTCTIHIVTPKGSVKIEGADSLSIKITLQELFTTET